MAITMKAARVNVNLSQERIADILGISRDYYHQIETGKVEPKPLYVYAFCQVVGCKPEDIILPNVSTKRSDGDES